MSDESNTICFFHLLEPTFCENQGLVSHLLCPAERGQTSFPLLLFAVACILCVLRVGPPCSHGKKEATYWSLEKKSWQIFSGKM